MNYTQNISNTHAVKIIGVEQNRYVVEIPGVEIPIKIDEQYLKVLEKEYPVIRLTQN